MYNVVVFVQVKFFVGARLNTPSGTFQSQEQSNEVHVRADTLDTETGNKQLNGISSQTTQDILLRFELVNECVE